MLSLVSLWVSGTYSGHAAGETFNSRLLELEHPVDIDISQFSRPDNLPEGDYQVDIYINERFLSAVKSIFSNKQRERTPALFPRLKKYAGYVWHKSGCHKSTGYD